jgi:hypothetical protein
VVEQGVQEIADLLKHHIPFSLTNVSCSAHHWEVVLLIRPSCLISCDSFSGFVCLRLISLCRWFRRSGSCYQVAAKLHRVQLWASRSPWACSTPSTYSQYHFRRGVFLRLLLRVGYPPADCLHWPSMPLYLIVALPERILYRLLRPRKGFVGSV